MECLFKKVQIIDPNSSYNGKKCDVLVKNGIITEINSKGIQKAKGKELVCDGSMLSPGWVDIGAQCGEPGYEHRETLLSLASAAAKGGYTSIGIFPNTKPIIHSKSEVQFIASSAKNAAVAIFPIGAVSYNADGDVMAEFLQMWESGAIAFSDGYKSIQKSSLLNRSLEYIKLIPQAIIINSCVDEHLAKGGQAHESEWSTYLGLKGIPNIAETTMTKRDIEIVKYAQSRLMIHKISCAETVQILKKEKSNLNGLFASVSAFNLAFDDSVLKDFESNFKLNPPLRDQYDRKALIKGILDGTIDLIVSDHTPLEPEKKEVEFQNAAFGAINLETAFAMMMSLDNLDISPQVWVEKTAIRPREIFPIPKRTIEEGQQAELTWFHPKQPWIYESSESKSLSKNSPFFGKKFNGKVLGVLVNERLIQF
ncbi:MAG: dihydroorotase [Bacteroidota bacterium]|nr:dihydroorotase [Bacteroidota bacterium]